jgi:hypothetical protein
MFCSMGNGYIWACSITYTEISGLAGFVPCPPLYPIVFYVSFMWEMTTLITISLKNWVCQEITTWIIP